MSYRLDLLPDEHVGEFIRTVDGLGIAHSHMDNNAWYCSMCSKPGQRVLFLQLEDADDNSQYTYICESCLYDLVRDKRLAVINFRTYARVMSEPSEPASPSATVDEDGVISIDGIAVNFT